MKLITLLFPFYIIGAAWAAMRWDWVAYLLAFVHAAGGVFLIYYAAYRWFQQRRYF